MRAFKVRLQKVYGLVISKERKIKLLNEENRCKDIVIEGLQG